MGRRRSRKIRPEVKRAGLVLLCAVLCVWAVSCIAGNRFSYDPITEVTMRSDPRQPCPYDLSRVTFENGIASYEDDQYESRFGIDVSSHNKDVDWQLMKSAGVQFAMIRVGYRGYTEGQLNLDEYFKKNIEGALSAGIEVGVYFFSQAVSDEEAAEEAKFVIEAIHDYDITWPVVYDMELYEEGTGARANGLTAEERTRCAAVFLENIKNAGYTPMMYASTYTYNSLFVPAELTSYPFWVAHYDGLCDYPYEYAMWQYSDEGNANGIPGGTDLNIAFVRKS